MKSEALKKAKEVLQTGQYTCAMCDGNEVITSQFRGVKPLVVWYESGRDYSSFSVADRVIGKATAFLYVLMGIKTVYTGVISRSALSVFEAARIYVEYDQLVDYVINRKGDGMCPFEATVLNIDEPAAAYKAIRAKMAEMNIPVE